MECKTLKLKKGEWYETSCLTVVGWTDGDGSENDGCHAADYFRAGIYLGPNEHGIEPIFEVEAWASPGQ